MESLRTRGIVLRLHRWHETSYIVTWLTSDYGKLKTVAKGARRPKSLMRGALDLFFCDELQFLRSAKSELHILQEAAVAEPFARIRADLPAFHAASYFVALTDAMTEVDSPVRESYQLLEEFLGALNRGETSIELVYSFEFRLLRALGFGARIEKLLLPRGTKALLSHLIEDSSLKLSRLKMSPAQTSQLDGLSRELFSSNLRQWPTQRELALTSQSASPSFSSSNHSNEQPRTTVSSYCNTSPRDYTAAP